MNRKHSYADFLAQVRYLRDKDPLFSISTDIIVGFPGETDEEFECTVHAMKECQFDFAYIARYSPRNGTRASESEDTVSAVIKAERWYRLTEVLQENIQARAELMIGRTEEILVSGKGKHGNWVGRTRNFKEVFITSEENLLGKILPVKIVRLDDWVLVGEVL